MYQNFNLAAYYVVHDLNQIKSESDLEKRFSLYKQYIELNKVYLETFRSLEKISKKQIMMIKAFFNEKGIKTSGGITLTSKNGLGGFGALCFSDNKNLELVKDIVKFTAELFDEIIFDDFFFTNCKCDKCIDAKGEKTWDVFRTELLAKVSSDLIIKTAKETSPNIKVIIKYPNWYVYYHNTGYNLIEQPLIFDGVYTGTETRDSFYTQQHLPRYLSYSLMRYLENVSPNRNLGGWFDWIDCSSNLGYYLEQGDLTVFAKAKEITLYHFEALYQKPVFLASLGARLNALDNVIGLLGNPIGIKGYQPFQSEGEEYLYDYLGMIGIPIELEPYFDEDADILLLTETSASDMQLIDKIKRFLRQGKIVVATSGLFSKCQEALQDIAQITITSKKALVRQYAQETQGCAFKTYSEGNKTVLIPKVEYKTNDTWPIIVSFDAYNNFPILLKSEYGKGKFYLLTIPDNISDLYHYSNQVLNLIRRTICSPLKVFLEAPSQISLFIYSQDCFIVNSFLLHHETVHIILEEDEDIVLEDLVHKVVVKGIRDGNGIHFMLDLVPSTYRVFKKIYNK